VNEKIQVIQHLSSWGLYTHRFIWWKHAYFHSSISSTLLVWYLWVTSG